MIKKTKSENGQVLVFLVVVLVALLGFSALAIDGGMIYADRRMAQNAADASAMAGVGMAAGVMDDLGVNSSNFKCPPTTGSTKVKAAIDASVTQAISRALANDFVIDSDVSDNMGVEITCHVENKSGYLDKYLDVRVVLNLDTRTSFAHLFTGTEAVTNTVEAVARVRPRSPLAFGNAIVSMGSGCGKNDNGGGGIEYDGGGNGFTRVTGGGIYSNTCLTGNGGIDLQTQCDTILYPGCTTRPPITYVTDYPKANAGIQPVPQKGTATLPLDNVTPPDCNDPKAIHHNSQVKLNNSGDSLNLAPGLHCFHAGIKATGGSLTGTDVTLVLLGGSFDVTGGVYVNLSAPNGDDVDDDNDGIVDETSEDLPAMRGMLIYVAPGTESDIVLSGGSTSEYTGTVFAPSSNIDVGGNSDTLKTVRTQLIGKYVKLHGNVTVDIRYVEEDNYPVLPKMELAN